MNAILPELRRRLANIVRIGTVSDVDTAKGLCRVRTGANETDWLNWLTPRAGRVRFWSAPSVGEQVIVLSIFGEMTTGFVLPAVFSDQHPAPSSSPDAVCIDFPDGAVIEYQPESSTLTAHGMKYADIQAAEKISATSNVVVVTAGQMITLDAPVVKCTNKLIAGSLLLKYGGEMYGNITHTGGGFNSNGMIVHLHYHGNVQNGSGNTGGANIMMYLGMNRNSGQAISEIDHIRQSVSDILITPVGSRVMRRKYGSQLSALIDQPQNPALKLQMMAAVYCAVLRWEDRISLTAVNITSNMDGKMVVDLVGNRTDTAGRIEFSLPIRGR